ncbi:hypothetical protein [Pseudoduganella lutea]|uniref:3-oxoacyl-ACP synthase n=1 Tax=Pseudoduganella lutea TaxID=321985 RepID=A0A4P6L4L6_9BURK|nr:hypothetical protein [Pseudoduganella lutea]QBE66540.1 hypothetical protein EWM63_29195 [Pseudoduganella lutea]
MIWGLRSTKDDSTAPQVASWAPLRIAARAMCCAVGHNAAAASAAINARVNHFRETDFMEGGSRIVGAALYRVDAWGAERLGLMLRAAIAEIITSQPGMDTGKVALLVLGAEAERPGMDSERVAAIVGELLAELREEGGEFHVHSGYRADGKGGVGKALVQAASLLAGADGPEQVLLVAVDSLLDAGAIESFLEQERIATTNNPDGFIPAEGAAAILLERASSAQPTPALWIESVAVTQEAWRLDSDLPLRATALTQAIRNATEAAHCQLASLDFHASGMTGESWYAKEVSMALARCMEHKKEAFPHLMVARNVGETGAASPVLTLAWLASLMAHPFFSPGKSALLHFAGDDGGRTAMVVRLREQQAI